MPSTATMNRRTALGAIGGASLAPLVLAGTSRPARAAAPPLGAARPTHYRFRLGGFEVTTLLDGAIQLEGPHPIFGQDPDAGGGAADRRSQFPAGHPDGDRVHPGGGEHRL